MSKRPRADEESWIDQHLGEAAMGSIIPLCDQEPDGEPFALAKGPLGFCIDPAAYKRKPKRKRG